MQDIIEKLAEIEKKANSVIDNSISGKVEIERKKKEELAELEEKLKEENRKNLTALQISLEKETQPEIDAVYKKSNEQLSAVETHFYFEREKMVDDLFNKITG